MGAPKSQPLQPIAEDLASLFPLSVSSIIAPVVQCIHPQPEGCSGHPDLAMRRWGIPTTRIIASPGPRQAMPLKEQVALPPCRASGTMGLSPSAMQPMQNFRCHPVSV